MAVITKFLGLAAILLIGAVNGAAIHAAGALDKRCTQFCYDPATSGCHPMNWDTCTGAEKSCLVANSQDAQGCLMAGECEPAC